MTTPRIGIKLADRRFFPIVDANVRGVRRKVTLSASRPDQKIIRIDLYKEFGEPSILARESNLSENLFAPEVTVEVPDPELLVAPEFIGSLELSLADSSPEVALVVGVDGVGNLNATVTDPVTGEYQSLSVSLSDGADDPLSGELPDMPSEPGSRAGAELDVPEFRANTGFADVTLPSESGGGNGNPVPGRGRVYADDGDFDDSTVADTLPLRERISGRSEGTRVNPILVAGYIVFCLAAIALLVYLIFRWLEVPAAPVLHSSARSAAHLSQLAFRGFLHS